MSESHGPKPKNPAPASERLLAFFTEIGEADLLDDLAEVVDTMSWLTQETVRLKGLLEAAGIDCQREEE